MKHLKLIAILISAWPGFSSLASAQFKDDNVISDGSQDTGMGT